MINTTDLHKLSYGAQDNHIENFFEKRKHIFEGQLIETLTHTISSENDLSKPTKIKLTDQYSSSDNNCRKAYYSHYGFANIQLVEKYCDRIERIDIEIAGMRINRIFPYINGATRVFEFADTNTILPALYEFEIVICVYFKYAGTCELTLDKMMITNRNKYDDMVEVMLKQSQYISGEVSNEGNNQLKLYFNHPVKKITVISEDDMEYSTKLCFDISKRDSENIEFQYTAPSNQNKCIYEFEETVNFSRIDRPYIIVNASHPTKIHVFADTLHIMNIFYGMIGMAFSK